MGTSNLRGVLSFNFVNIRNFSIIAHIDHGKSTLADRLLEQTGTIDPRQMRAQVLDSLPLERERGITIKMAPVSMTYLLKAESYKLNLIDTPGHIDFSYEVSRALTAVEGAILLIDATKGVQAQTLSVLGLARKIGLAIIPVINKIDLPVARVEEAREEIMKLLNCPADDIVAVSAKTGAGVTELLETIIKRVPAPRLEPEIVPAAAARGLVFDFEYSPHRGLIVYLRLFDGAIKRGDQLIFAVAKERFIAHEVGTFRPDPRPSERLVSGEIGYIVTGVKSIGRAKVGETVLRVGATLPPFPGYVEPKPMVWASIYPTSQPARTEHGSARSGGDDFALLSQSLSRLRLTDAALSFEEESSGSLGRGFRCGFLGMLHLEIITERLRREFNLSLTVAAPSTSYEIVDEPTGRREIIYSPHRFPNDLKGRRVYEPWVKAQILTPPEYGSVLLKLFREHEARVLATELWGRDRTSFQITLPLRELMRRFFDELKSLTSGFASLAYEAAGLELADVVRLDVLVAEEPVLAFTRVAPRGRLEREAKEVVNRLAELLPRQLFTLKIQARADGRILASRSLTALKKDVTGYLYGGDITRKRKLWEKQKRGKKRLLERGTMTIPPAVFLKMVSGSGEK